MAFRLRLLVLLAATPALAAPSLSINLRSVSAGRETSTEVAVNATASRGWLAELFGFATWLTDLKTIVNLNTTSDGVDIAAVMGCLNTYRAQQGCPAMQYNGGLANDAQQFVDSRPPSPSHVGRKWQWQGLYSGGYGWAPTAYLLLALDAFHAEGPAGGHFQDAFMCPIPVQPWPGACLNPSQVGFAINAQANFASFYYTCPGEQPCFPNCPP